MFQALTSPDAKHIEIQDEDTGILLSLHTDDPQFDEPPGQVAEKIVLALNGAFHGDDGARDEIADALLELATAIVSHSHTDAAIAREERLHDLAQMVRPGR